METSGLDVKCWILRFAFQNQDPAWGKTKQKPVAVQLLVLFLFLCAQEARSGDQIVNVVSFSLGCVTICYKPNLCPPCRETAWKPTTDLPKLVNHNC